MIFDLYEFLDIEGHIFCKKVKIDTSNCKLRNHKTNIYIITIYIYYTIFIFIYCYVRKLILNDHQYETII